MSNCPAHDAHVVRIDADWNEIATQPATAVRNTTLPDNLAYVIYTSGSTGKAKGGRCIQHAMLLAVLSVGQKQPGSGVCTSEDDWTFDHSICFDLSVFELFGAVLSQLAAKSIRRSVVDQPCDRRVSGAVDAKNASQSRINTVPSAIDGLSRVDQLEHTPNKLRRDQHLLAAKPLSQSSLGSAEAVVTTRHGDEFNLSIIFTALRRTQPIRHYVSSAYTRQRFVTHGGQQSPDWPTDIEHAGVRFG